MSKPAFRWKGFETKVARRVLILFLFCAGLPVLTFAVLGYVQVRSELTDQSWQRLSVASETVAMSLIERLLLLEADLSRGGLDREEGAPLVLGDGGLWLSRNQVSASSLEAGVGDGLPVDLNPSQASALERGATILRSGRAPNELVMLRSAPRKGVIWWGTINPGYLESVAQILPDQTALCVRTTRRLLVGCEEPAPNEMTRAMPRSMTSDQITWTGSDGARLGVQRELFLASEFSTDSWRILVSEPRSAGMAAIQSFTRTLALVVILSVLLVALASDVQLNRMLGPVARLKEGTERVAQGDLASRVQVATGDEFEELADSFNDMVGRIGGLLEALDQLNIGTIRALASAIDAKSHWTSGHSERVTQLSVELGRELGLDAGELEVIERGAILHDVGKIAVPLAVLDKPGPLDDQEWQAMRAHTLHGVKIVEPITQYAPLLPIIEQHHERWDGTGYPHGLNREEIDFKARIVAVADTFDAMTSDRPYREGLPIEKALSIIETERGIGFDPRVVDAFLRIHASGIATPDVTPLNAHLNEDVALKREVRRMA